METGEHHLLHKDQPVFRAAEYVRMSTEHQQYSTHNQVARIREYADQRGIKVVKTYADEGKSGLRIAGRLALQQLISDVESRVVDFSMVLVYDVSRWGRFQDADESAYYEYLCKRAGIQVVCRANLGNPGPAPLSLNTSVAYMRIASCAASRLLGGRRFSQLGNA